MDYKLEFKPIDTLDGDAAVYFTVPLSLIKATEMHPLRLSVFAYLSAYRGLNNKICFSIPLFLSWAGYKSDAHAGGINDKVIDTLNRLNALGYIVYCGSGPITRSSCFEIKFNRNLVYTLSRSERFAILYWDEIQKIMQYKNKNLQDRYLNANTVLLVFAFLRQAIFRLPNKLEPEERNPEGIANRRKRCIEAYNGNYKNIGSELGLSERTVSLAVKVLVQLKLIVIADPYHIRNEDGEFRTPDIIFTNAYKRDGTKLLIKGDKYAFGEIKRKEEYLRSYIPDYRTRPTV